MGGCRYCSLNHQTKDCNHPNADNRRLQELKDKQWSEFVLGLVKKSVEQVLEKFLVPYDLRELITEKLVLKAGRLSRATELRFLIKNKETIPREIVPKRFQHKI